VADRVQVKDSAPSEYTVKQGDTLWHIASLYLQQPWQWPAIWRNNIHLRNPHLIYPGDRLRLVFNEQGEPEVILAETESKRHITLTPQSKTRTKAEPVTLLPWNVIGPYLENVIIMSAAEYQSLPELLGDQQGRINFASDDVVLSAQHASEVSQFQVIRKQFEIYNMQNELMGYQIRHIADAEPVQTDLREQILVKIQQSNLEARPGDKLIAERNFEPLSLRLMPTTTQSGSIIGNLQQRKLLGKYDVAVIDLGIEQIQAGTVMGIYQAGPDIIRGDSPRYANDVGASSLFTWRKQINQPALKVGELVVFKVFDRVSYGLIMRSSEVISRGAIVSSP
jgi:hypothetical protein